MAVGALFGLTQTNVKRLLAYSSIAHVGFLLVGVVPAVAAQHGAALGGMGSLAVTWYYLAAYGAATLGAFGVCLIARGGTLLSADFDTWSGFGRRNPVAGGAMALFLLSLAGIPLTGGFTGKLFAFSVAWLNGWAWLAIAGLVLSLVTAAFYLRLIWVMFWGEPKAEVEPARPSVALSALIGLCALATLALGLVPAPFVAAASQAAVLMR
jgi:NADH-quinone oxidoreductase subunit N